MDVHARDVVAQLAAEGIEGQPQHFSWLSQLRMYWEQPPGQSTSQAKSIVVRMMNAQAEYGYEYLGASSRLVVTPLTDRWVQWLSSQAGDLVESGVSRRSCPFVSQGCAMLWQCIVWRILPIACLCADQLIVCSAYMPLLQVLPDTYWGHTPAHGRSSRRVSCQHASGGTAQQPGMPLSAAAHARILCGHTGACICSGCLFDC